jgi:hypothetical protein
MQVRIEYLDEDKVAASGYDGSMFGWWCFFYDDDACTECYDALGPYNDEQAAIEAKRKMEGAHDD